MINCIAVDDEPKALDVIHRYCKKIDSLSLKAQFREPVKAVEFLRTEKVELLFLDINMPELNGIQLFSTLADKPMVIFTTAYSEYAIESYRLNAIDYLLKPITFERFLQSVNKASELIKLKNNSQPGINSSKADFIFLKSGPQTHKVKVDDIYYLEKDGNYITVYSKEKKILLRENMTDIFDLIPKEGFIRVHKSFIVASRHIETIESEQVIVNKTKIPLGITYRDAFLKEFKLS